MMASTGKVKVGIIGSRFEADIHAESFRILPDEAEVVAVASPTPGNAAAVCPAAWHPAFLYRLPTAAGRAGHRDGHHRGPELLARPDDRRLRPTSASTWSARSRFA